MSEGIHIVVHIQETAVGSTVDNFIQTVFLSGIGSSALLDVLKRDVMSVEGVTAVRWAWEKGKKREK